MKLNLNCLETFIHYHGVKSAEKKLNRLVCSFRKTFMTLRSFENCMLLETKVGIVEQSS